MPKLSDLEIRRRLMQDKVVRSNDAVEIPQRKRDVFVCKVLSRTNACLARRQTFKQQAST